MFARANREMVASIAADARRRAERGRLPLLMAAIDRLLNDLEELNLKAVDRVPPELRRRSANVLEMVPGHGELQVRYRVVPMMDVLFHAQELLLRQGHPPEPELESAG
ncbi:MAG: hypothetical protein ACREPI_13485 [Candidatus Dormibacterales bacterium]